MAWVEEEVGKSSKGLSDMRGEEKDWGELLFIEHLLCIPVALSTVTYTLNLNFTALGSRYCLHFPNEAYRGARTGSRSQPLNGLVGRLMRQLRCDPKVSPLCHIALRGNKKSRPSSYKSCHRAIMSYPLPPSAPGVMSKAPSHATYESWESAGTWGGWPKCTRLPHHLKSGK